MVCGAKPSSVQVQQVVDRSVRKLDMVFIKHDILYYISHLVSQVEFIGGGL